MSATLILFVTRVCTGLAAAGVTGDDSLIVDILMSHLATLPAMLVILGIIVGLFGLLPRLMSLVGWLLASKFHGDVC